MATASDLANQVYDCLTSPDQPPMSKGERNLLRFTLDMAAMALDSLPRIASALERIATAQEGIRPAHDALDAL